MIKQITSEVTSIEFKKFGSIVYLIRLAVNGQLSTVLIDTSSKENKEELLSELSKLNLKSEDIQTIILTHAHYDHIENTNLFPNAKIYGNFTKSINTYHSQTELRNILPIDNQPIKDFQIHKLPGHSPGDIAILYKNILFSGDIIFHSGYIGRNDFPESNLKEQQKSLQILSKLKFDTLCPGH
ncbi:MAG: MBL fold metallo-hydrolase [Nanoarchaeota archaeon]|jgi:glyoxylase-like metal-dependent hydrolase (beta-lactamase superfamily II)|nr:MBL fold metallo-hydrolase [Nanoarchaeota archaeon]